MGGIKNRSLLNKAINKVPLWLKGNVRRQSDKGIVFKYLGIACLSLAILSTITLNLISTYSSSNTNSNAEPVGDVSTLANIDPASISISISSYPSSSSTGGNNPNLSLLIPQGGGIATGRHTVTISVGSDVQEYRARFSSKTEETALVNESDSNTKIPAIDTFHVDGDGSTEDLERVLAGVSGNVWAYSYEEHGKAPAITMARVDALPPASSPDIFQYDLDAVGTSSTDINYGVKVEHPESMPAGNYVANIVYTATVEQLRQPILTSVAPSTYELGSGADNTIAITGKYLSTASKAYLVHASTGEQYYCTNLQVTSTDASGSATLTCDVPTDQTNPNIEPGTYGVYVLTNAGETAYTDAATFTYTKSSICRNNDPDSDCQVDIDDNMIPIAYDGYDGNGGGSWRIVTKEEIENDKGSWYDYGNKQWANAITLRDDYEGGCFLVTTTGIVVSQDSSGCSNTGGTSTRYTPLGLAKAWRDGELSVVDAENLNATLFGSDAPDGIGAEGIILGYWVYIPRYAYEVMRPNAVDRVVNDTIAKNEGGFDIRFETVNDTKKIPAESCNLGISTADQMWANGTPTSSAGPTNTNILAKDYRTGCGIDRTYPDNDATKSNGQTTWATHPAFSWGTEETGYTELNGIWVGKFETTGKVNAPTVKPNQHANISEYIGEFYAMARSIGAGTYDPTAEGGNTISGITQNSHHLDSATSHMLKNSEWGAVAYLSASKYGAGVNGTQPNTARPTNGKDADGDPTSTQLQARYGITGCGPNSKTNESSYSSVTVNGETVSLPALSADHIEDPLACGDKAHAYNGEIGVYASTTNTVYGIYDMSGGAYEYVMGNLTGYDDQSETSSGSYMTTQAKPPYVDLYKESQGFDYSSSDDTNPDWSKSTSVYYYNNDVCTWATCGGHALHETKQYQSVSSSNRSWGHGYSEFVYSSYRWFLRGGHAGYGPRAGLFYSSYNNGSSDSDYGFRAALLALPAGQ